MFSGPYCKSDRAVLTELFDVWDGGNWRNRTGWLESDALETWYGVQVDSSGRVVTLDLRWNGLSGFMSPGVVGLTRLTMLRLDDNDLDGRLSLTLTSSGLTELTYAGTGICVPTGEEFQQWLSSLTTHHGTGIDCLSDRGALELLYAATGGPNWGNSDNWLSDRPLGEWYGVTTDGDGRVTGLELGSNQLAGEIPAELGQLSRLRTLHMGHSHLTGEIPIELAQLSNLQVLSLGDNRLGGEIPPALGQLSDLQGLFLYQNELTGEIPSELGQLANLEVLHLGGSQLTGEIPSELGQLSNLQELYLYENQFAGQIPASYQRLSELWRLWFFGNLGLCAPGTGAFVDWSDGVEHVWGPYCNEEDIAILTALFDAWSGENWTDRTGWLESNALERWYGVEADSSGRVVTLDLHGNELSGLMNSGLAGLQRLTVLRLDDNGLDGRLSIALTKLRLTELSYTDTGICEPTGEEFRQWLNSLSRHDGTGIDCDPLSDRGVLDLLYASMGGPKWGRNDNWLTDHPLGDWYGVSTDNASGRVTGIVLAGNNLKGGIPSEIGQLSELQRLNLGGNQVTGVIPDESGYLSHVQQSSITGDPSNSDTVGTRQALQIQKQDLGQNRLTGEIPSGLGQLSKLRWLDISANQLTGKIPSEFGRLANLELLDLQENELSGEIPPELGQLSNLQTLSLTANQFTGEIPSELGQLSSLEYLHLTSNPLSGEIPPELGQLANLRELSIQFVPLSGAIPPELGQLANLRILAFGWNRLTGGIPPELGQLSNLLDLDLAQTLVTGPIPSELGRLSNLQRLSLWGNQLTSPIPSRLGQLSSLEEMIIGRNPLAGNIPSGFGQLSNLRMMWLTESQLTGQVPPEFGNLASLEEMTVSQNPGLNGALPSELAAMDRMRRLGTAGTALCAPSDPAFLDWLYGLDSQRLRKCDQALSAAYMVQAVQSREFPVPLVADEPALLRVFVTATEETTETMPPVRATFFHDGVQVHTADIPRGSRAIPRRLTEGDLELSANVQVPGEIIQEGLEMVLEVDPDGVVDPALGVRKRIPETGREAVRVRSMPRFDLTVVPFVWDQDQDSSIVVTLDGMVADPDEHELLEDTRRLLPVAGMFVSAHEPVLTSNISGRSVLQEVDAMRLMEGGGGYWAALVSRFSNERLGGIAFISGWASASLPRSDVIAHEFGHNMGLWHAPCGGPAQVDAEYPYLDGSIGAWNYDIEKNELVAPNTYLDLMSYCDPIGVSDYHFTNATGHRLRAETAVNMAAMTATPQPTLLVWGGADADSVPSLDPAFFVDATPFPPPRHHLHPHRPHHGRRDRLLLHLRHARSCGRPGGQVQLRLHHPRRPRLDHRSGLHHPHGARRHRRAQRPDQ